MFLRAIALRILCFTATTAVSNFVNIAHAGAQRNFLSVEGLMIRESKPEASGVFIDPGTERQEFYTLDFSQSVLRTPDSLKKIALPVKLRLCVELMPNTRRLVRDIKPLGPTEKIKFYDKIPGDFATCAARK